MEDMEDQINIIRSKNNALIKKVTQLKQKKYRDQLKTFLGEGFNILEEAVLSQIRLKAVLVCYHKSTMEKWQTFQKSINLNEEVPVHYVVESVFSLISATETSQGVICMMEKPTRDIEAYWEQGQGNFLWLDKLQDPGNVGTLIRTAEATGISGVILSKETVDPFSPKVVRATTGSLFRMPLFFIGQPGLETDLSLIKKMKSKGKQLVCTLMGARTSYRDVILKHDLIIVIGNEGNGVSPIFQENADIQLSIPMKGQVESLNASIAGALIMYEMIG